MHRQTLSALVATGALLCSAATWAASPTLDKIKETKQITLGYRESSVPFSFLDGANKPVGFSMDLCAAIVNRVKQQLALPSLDVKYVAVNSSNRIPLVKNGTVDIECGGTANNAQRQKEVAFSVATFVSQPKWLVRADSNINNVAALKGQTVVVTQGSNAVAFAKAASEQQKLDLKIVQAKDHGESMLMLDTKRAAGFLEDDILLAAKKAEAKDPKGFKFLPESYEIIYYGLMLPKDDPEFKAVVDKTLSDAMASGAFEQTYKKWFESPIPPHNTNLQFPVSDPLRARIKSPSDKATQ